MRVSCFFCCSHVLPGLGIPVMDVSCLPSRWFRIAAWRKPNRNRVWVPGDSDRFLVVAAIGGSDTEAVQKGIESRRS